jgi:hypothetical protein
LSNTTNTPYGYLDAALANQLRHNYAPAQTNHLFQQCRDDQLLPAEIELAVSVLPDSFPLNLDGVAAKKDDSIVASTHPSAQRLTV